MRVPTENGDDDALCRNTVPYRYRTYVYLCTRSHVHGSPEIFASEHSLSHWTIEPHWRRHTWTSAPTQCPHQSGQINEVSPKKASGIPLSLAMLFDSRLILMFLGDVEVVS